MFSFGMCPRHSSGLASLQLIAGDNDEKSMQQLFSDMLETYEDELTLSEEDLEGSRAREAQAQAAAGGAAASAGGTGTRKSGGGSLESFMLGAWDDGADTADSASTAAAVAAALPSTTPTSGSGAGMGSTSAPSETEEHNVREKGRFDDMDFDSWFVEEDDKRAATNAKQDEDGEAEEVVGGTKRKEGTADKWILPQGYELSASLRWAELDLSFGAELGYAQALFSLGRRRGTLDTISRELQELCAHVFRDHSMLQTTTFELGTRLKRRMAAKALLRTMNASRDMTQFIKVLCEVDKLSMLFTITSYFLEMNRFPRLSPHYAPLFLAIDGLHVMRHPLVLPPNQYDGRKNNTDAADWTTDPAFNVSLDSSTATPAVTAGPATPLKHPWLLSWEQTFNGMSGAEITKRINLFKNSSDVKGLVRRSFQRSERASPKDQIPAPPVLLLPRSMSLTQRQRAGSHCDNLGLVHWLEGKGDRKYMVVSTEPV